MNSRPLASGPVGALEALRDAIRHGAVQSANSGLMRPVRLSSYARPNEYPEGWLMTEAAQEVWLYNAGAWRRAPDPITWQDGDDVHERYAQAGYAADLAGLPFIDLGFPGDASGSVGLTLWTRREAPECIIDIEGRHGETRSVYVNSFPEALDLMARWAPLVTASTPIAEARDGWERQQAERHNQRVRR